MTSAVILIAGCDLPGPTEPLEPSLEFRTTSDPTSTIESVSLGSEAACVTTLDGSGKCWGRNDVGQLGRGDLVDTSGEEPSELDFIDLGAPAQQIVTNGRQTYAILDDGTVRAWGDNSEYALGLQHDETIGDDETPATATVAVDVELGSGTAQLALGSGFACARSVAGSIRCWGANDLGQLGRGHTDRIGDDEPPSAGQVVFLGAPAIDLAAGLQHACGLNLQGKVYCWGRGAEGQLGYGDTENRGDDELPITAGYVDIGGSATQIVAGGHHTCALLTSGKVRCWGDGHDGILGLGYSGNVGDDETPASQSPVAVGGPVVSLATGLEHTCAMLDMGGMRCWGSNDFGQLGHGDDEIIGDDEKPSEVDEVDVGGHSITRIFAGPLSHSTCAQSIGASVRCWGSNDFGQLGYGHMSDVGDDPEERPGYLPDLLIIVDDEA